MKKEIIDNIKKMISSSDKENSYLAAVMLRKNPLEFTRSTSSKLLKSIPLLDRIKDYSDICEELGERELVIEDFHYMSEDLRVKSLAHSKLLQIAKLINGSSKKNIWYPYFNKTGYGLVFRLSNFRDSGFDGLVFFIDEPTSDFVGKTFKYLYEDLV